MKFEELQLNSNIMKAIEKLGFTEPTPIQAKCIPEIKAGKDLVGQSFTGSGKTAAFGFPILEKIVPGNGIQALVLAPTRELANQVRETLIKFAFFMKLNITAVYGGVSMGPQVNDLRRADIVVATPGRLLDHIQRRTINLERVNFLVIDEADKMFEMGFIEDVEKIIRTTPTRRQTLLFSATMSQEVLKLVKNYLRNPSFIKEQIHVDKSLLKQVYYDIRQQEKFSLLVHLIKKNTSGLVIVFCGTRRQVDVIAKNLKMQQIDAMAVHGGLSQNRRDHAVDSLKRENIQVLVATDIAARGLDINNISNIYNYDSPKNAEEYTHRIGRTARAGKSGEAITLISERDHANFRSVLSDRNLHITKEALPEFERVHFIVKAEDHHQGRFDHQRSNYDNNNRRSFRPRFGNRR
ncbi:MAG: DEAD/DEAH box helicase [Candidatus Nanoarchaeia archaeon]|nr:DEAD/DEAH box helicase [Candidatus Nanoarchaeia archaeon]